MTGLSIAQLCADKGIRPGSTKGAALHLRGVATGLRMQGHKVTTYAAREAEGPFPVPVHPAGHLACEIADGRRPDIIYERYSLGHRHGFDLARQIGVPYVLEVNAPLVDEATTHRPNTVPDNARTVEAALLAEADLVITVSSGLTGWVERIRKRPTVTIGNGFEPAWFCVAHGVIEKRGTAADPTNGRLVFLGHPKPWHGADRLPPMLSILSQRGFRPELVIIGGGPGVEELRRIAAGLGVDSQLIITGPVPPTTVAGILRSATIGLAPYRAHDPFYFSPLKVIDYMAAGLPVVASDQGDIASLVCGDGILVDADDDFALAEAVAHLLGNPVLGRDLGTSARTRAFDTLTWGHVAAKTVAAIEALCE